MRLVHDDAGWFLQDIETDESSVGALDLLVVAGFRRSLDELSADLLAASD